MATLRNFSSIPVLDIGAMLQGSTSDKQAFAQQLADVSRSVGFFHLAGHGIPAVHFSELRSMAEQFFALPEAQKMAVYIGLSKNHRGYVPEGEEVFAAGSRDRKEAFDLAIDLRADDPLSLAGNPLLGPNQWPDIPGFRQVVQSYYDRTFEVGRALLRGFALALGQDEMFFNPFVTRPPSQLRLIHYPFDADAAVDVMGIGAHTDYECFTLLHATAAGLQALNGLGLWIDVHPVPDAFIVNIGDMMEILTNGEFVATSHRVRRVKEERYAFPFFFSLDYDTRVAPLENYIRPGEKARPGLIAGEHLFAQTAQSFGYQKARLARGEIRLPDTALHLSSFGQEALLRAGQG
jgi:isopenicillin N synthase-like dioxygenase